MSVNKEVDIIITALERNHLLARLINSIRSKYPNVYITVADQSRKTFETTDEKVKVIDLPFDCGLSKARNRLIRETVRPYVLLLEDDFLFREDTDIEKMLKVIKSDKDIGIVGGRVLQHNQPIRFEFKFKRKDDVLYQVPDGDVFKDIEGVMCKETECVLNFSLIKRELLRDVMWDERLKLREHTDFYYRLSDTDWRVLFTEEVKIDDGKEHGWPNKEYKKLKDRDHFWSIVLKKHGLNKVKYLNGYCIKLDECDKIIKDTEQVENFNKL